MADDTLPPPRSDVRAGGLLDLSTGPGAPPPEPTPRPPVTPDPEVRAGRTLDLSVKPAGTASRKPPLQDFGGGLVLREKVDLSTKRPEPAAAPAETPKASPRRDPPRGGGGRKDARGRGGRDESRGRDGRDAGRPTGTAPASASSSLADLLDPEMLAKLRGG